MIPFKSVLIVLLNKASCVFPDKFYLWLQFYLRMGYSFNLNNPKTLSEKIQWLKLNYKNPLYPSLVDKYSVKDYISNKIGKEHVIKTIGVWDDPESIEWDKLPKQFVLKTTHGGGNSGVIVCADKNQLDRIKTIHKLQRSLKQDIYKEFREWPYQYIKKRIIAEQFMSQDDGTPLIDYKLFCFNGQPHYIYVSQNVPGAKRTLSAFLDLNWQLMLFKKKNDSFAHTCPPKPKRLEELTKIASILAKELPFVRVDLYEINNKVFFSELTFYPSSGMQPYEPIEWDKKLGDLLVLPEPLNYNQYD